MKIQSIVLVFVFINCILTAKVISSNNNNNNNQIDFQEAVKKFCNGKVSKNFCSNEHLKLMFELEKKRQDALEMERQMKRMESEVIKKLMKMYNLTKQVKRRTSK